MDQTVPQYGGRESLLRREILIIAAGIVLVLSSAYAAWFLIFRQNAPDAVVRKFIEADRAGRFGDQQALIARSVGSSMILDTVQAFRRQSGVSPFENYRMLTNTIDGSAAQVDVEVTINPSVTSMIPGASLPQTMVVPFHLLREDDQWKIDPTRTVASLTGVLLALGFQQLMPRLQNLIPPGFPPPVASPPQLRQPGISP